MILSTELWRLLIHDEGKKKTHEKIKFHSIEAESRKMSCATTRTWSTDNALTYLTTRITLVTRTLGEKGGVWKIKNDETLEMINTSLSRALYYARYVKFLSVNVEQSKNHSKRQSFAE